jgi:hypothetical protein
MLHHQHKEDNQAVKPLCRGEPTSLECLTAPRVSSHIVHLLARRLVRRLRHRLGLFSLALRSVRERVRIKQAETHDYGGACGGMMGVKDVYLLRGCGCTYAGAFRCDAA